MLPSGPPSLRYHMRLHITYGADVEEINVYRSDAAGNWDSDRRIVWYPDGSAGEAVWAAGQWPGTANGYILVTARPGCGDWNGLAGVSTQIIHVPSGECPIFPPPTKIYELFSQFQTPGSTPAKFQKTATPSMRMQVALGTVFSLGLQVREGALAPVETIPSIIGKNVAEVM